MGPSKAKQATKEQKARFSAMADLGCAACRMDGRTKGFCGAVEIHHLLDGGRRRGHSFTVPLGGWHHSGRPPGTLTKAEATDYYGPSLAYGSRPFRGRYGSDDDLLEFTNTLLASAGLGKR